MKKGIVTLMAVVTVILLVLVNPLVSQAAAEHGFPDVNPRHDNQMNYLAELGVVTGLPDGTYGVDEQVNRELAAAMISRALGIEEFRHDTNFNDIDRNNPYSGYIHELNERDIILGDGNGNVHPEEILTRGDMSMLLTRAFPDLVAGGASIQFPDVGSNMQARDAIQVMAATGVTIGFDDGTFRPLNDVTRMEFALFLARSMNEEFRGISTSEDYQLAEVTATSLNVRPLPNTSRPPIGRLLQYTPVKVLDRSNNWARIEYKGTFAYVSESWLKYHERGKYGNGLQGKTIVIDAGHGGSDIGGSGNGLLEKDIVIDISLMMELKLMQAGADVIMTRTEDVRMSLPERVAISNSSGGDAFISVHANAAFQSAYGAEAFYNVRHEAARSKALGDALVSRMVNDMNMRDRRWGAAVDTDLGNITSGLGVLLNNRIPSVLVEVGFMTNSTEAARLRTESFRYGMAEALTQGTIDYMKR